MALNKNFVVKNGLEVNTNQIFADSATGKVGIGSTLPTVELDVQGAIAATDVVSSLLRVTGYSTLPQTTVNDNLTVLGFTTATNELNVLGISSLSNTRVVGVTTFENNVNLDGNVNVTGFSTFVGLTSVVGNLKVSGFTTFTDLTVSGVSTFVGLSTFGDGIIVTSGISTLGITTATDLTAESVNVSGIGTIAIFESSVGTITNLSGTIGTIGGVQISSGIITASSGIVTYYGDGQYLQNLASNPNLQTVLDTGNTATIGLSVTGIVTATSFSGNVSVTQTSANGTYFPVLVSSSATGNRTLYVDDGQISYNPSTNFLSLFNQRVYSGLYLSDNVELYFGSSNDAWFNYNGTGNYLELQLESAATDFRITDDGTERFRFVKSTGSLGIGTTNPTATLDVNGDALISGIVTATSFTSSGNITANGNIVGDTATNISGINSVTATTYYGDGSQLSGISGGLTISDDTTTNSTFYPTFTSATSGTITSENVSSTKLTFNPSTGTLAATDLNSTSDVNLKKDIEVINDAIEILEKINGIRFKWKENDRESIGVIAQEVEKVLPELVSERVDTGTKSVNYNGLIGVLIEAVKELSIKIDNLNKKSL